MPDFLACKAENAGESGILVGPRGNSQECRGCGRFLGTPKHLAFLDRGANVATRDLQGRPPLHYVTLVHRRGDVARAVNVLLGAGADSKAADMNGDTTLSLAKARRDAITISALNDAGIIARTTSMNASSVS